MKVSITLKFRYIIGVVYNISIKYCEKHDGRRFLGLYKSGTETFLLSISAPVTSPPFSYGGAENPGLSTPDILSLQKSHG